MRYPGGKASLAGLLALTIKLNGLSGCPYFEPFAGGAGAALRLLREGVVSELYLNDLDPRVYAFWNAALGESQKFADAIRSVPLNIEEWRNQRQVCTLGDTGKQFELGFATFYLNRCNRSGIVHGAAPIGGYAQSGPWKIDARFYRESLAERILAIGRRREQIHVTNMDARDFLGARLPRGSGRKSVFVYFDPPYYSRGDRLYMNLYSDSSGIVHGAAPIGGYAQSGPWKIDARFYRDQDHMNLATYIQKQYDVNWIMSYDDTAFVRHLYQACDISQFSLEYSLHKKRKAQELLISPSRVKLADPVESTDALGRGLETTKTRKQ